MTSSQRLWKREHGAAPVGSPPSTKGSVPFRGRLLGILRSIGGRESAPNKRQNDERRPPTHESGVAGKKDISLPFSIYELHARWLLGIYLRLVVVFRASIARMCLEVYTFEHPPPRLACRLSVLDLPPAPPPPDLWLLTE